MQKGKAGRERNVKSVFKNTAFIGKERMDALAGAKVAIFGISGVSGYVIRSTCRSGVGSFVIVDDDKVCLTNINRQIYSNEKDNRKI